MIAVPLSSAANFLNAAVLALDRITRVLTGSEEIS
jgi:hypothetical protein